MKFCHSNIYIIIYFHEDIYYLDYPYVRKFPSGSLSFVRDDVSQGMSTTGVFEYLIDISCS
jgi:hypothetical protein